MCPKHWHEAADLPATIRRSRHRAASKSCGSFFGSGDCPARPEYVAVRGRLHEATERAQPKAPVAIVLPPNRADLFSVEATVRLGLSMLQSVEGCTKRLSEPNQKPQSPLYCLQIVRIFFR